MKVNTTLLDPDKENEQPETQADMPAADQTPKADTAPDPEDDGIDESGKHSKIKTVVLIAMMLGGFGLFVHNMTGLVNNMRLDNQGQPTGIVYEMEDLQSFLNTDGENKDAAATDAEGQTDDEASTDAARDGPGITLTGDETMEELIQKTKDALNEAAFVKQELKNAEDMLNSSLQREADLKSQLESLAK